MIKIKLTKGQGAIVDDCDAHLTAWSWYAHYDRKKRGHYAVKSIYIGGGRAAPKYLNGTIHHAVMGMPLNRRLMVDHINGDTLDNRRLNLRFVFQRENQANQYKHRNGKLIGASQFFRGGWKSQIKIDGKQIHLGLFKTPEEASSAYQQALKKLIGGKK